MISNRSPSNSKTIKQMSLLGTSVRARTFAVGSAGAEGAGFGNRKPGGRERDAAVITITKQTDNKEYRSNLGIVSNSMVE
jgi:hypothetical protein